LNYAVTKNKALLVFLYLFLEKFSQVLRSQTEIVGLTASGYGKSFAMPADGRMLTQFFTSLINNTNE